MARILLTYSSLLKFSFTYSSFLLTPTGRVFCILQVSVSRCVGCYQGLFTLVLALSPPMKQKCSHLIMLLITLKVKVWTIFALHKSHKITNSFFLTATLAWHLNCSSKWPNKFDFSRYDKVQNPGYCWF